MKMSATVPFVDAKEASFNVPTIDASMRQKHSATRWMTVEISVMKSIALVHMMTCSNAPKDPALSES